MIVAIHQPNFFPWLGFFEKMRQVDVFVLLDNVPFTKGGYQNRVQLKSKDVSQWLTVPVMTKGQFGQLTNAVCINNKIEWKKAHLKTFSNLYGKAKYFENVYRDVEDIYSYEQNKLVDITIPGILYVKDKFGLSAKVYLASELAVSGKGSLLLANIVKAVGGSVYLSGPSGRKYIDETTFNAANIEIQYHEFHVFEYDQVSLPFISGLSSLDYLFNNYNKPWWT